MQSFFFLLPSLPLQLKHSDSSTQQIAFDLAKVQVTVSDIFLHHSSLYFHLMNTDELDT